MANKKHNNKLDQEIEELLKRSPRHKKKINLLSNVTVHNDPIDFGEEVEGTEIGRAKLIYPKTKSDFVNVHEFPYFKSKGYEAFVYNSSGCLIYVNSKAIWSQDIESRNLIDKPLLASKYSSVLETAKPLIKDHSCYSSFVIPYVSNKNIDYVVLIKTNKEIWNQEELEEEVQKGINLKKK